jgi:RND family efflux transporter MFP subunit
VRAPPAKEDAVVLRRIIHSLLNTSRGRIGVSAFSCAVLLSDFAAGEDSARVSASFPEPKSIVGFVLPAQVSTLACVHQARIARILVKEGDGVEAGALLAQMDDGYQRARTEMARVEAESTLAVELARARWRKAERDWSRLQKLHGSDSASSKELSDAYAETETRRLEYELAHLAQAQAARGFEREKELLAQLQIRAPFRGYVSRIHRQDGETVDIGEPIVTVARLDVLEAVASVPLESLEFLRPGEALRVRPVDGRWSARPGTIRFASRVADAASQTIEVRVSIDNADGGWPAGIKAYLDFAELSNTEKGDAPGERASRPDPN